MTDIVDRLRSLYVQHGTNYVQEAADIIEALRTDNATLRAALQTQAEEAAKLMRQRDEFLASMKRASEIIGRFVSNEGWKSTDMDYMDYIDAITANATT